MHLKKTKTKKPPLPGEKRSLFCINCTPINFIIENKIKAEQEKGLATPRDLWPFYADWEGNSHINVALDFSH